MVGRFNNNIKYTSKFNYFSYMAFRYHHLFFHSLIFRGRKLWAFNFFVLLKYELKKREMVDPFWVFLVSLMKITPEFILSPLKLGGKTQFVALPISEKKQYIFAVKFVIKLIRDRFRKLNLSLVCDALVSSIYNKGISIEKKTSLYQIALSIDIYLDFLNRFFLVFSFVYKNEIYIIFIIIKFINYFMFFLIFFYIVLILSVLLNNKAFFINEEFLIFICFLFFGFILLKLVKKIFIYFLFFEVKSIYIYFQFLILTNINIINKIIFIFKLLKFKFFFNMIAEYLFSIINFYNIHLNYEKFKLLFIKNLLISLFISYLDIKLYYFDLLKKFINQINFNIINKLVIFSIFNFDKVIKKYII